METLILIKNVSVCAAVVSVAVMGFVLCLCRAAALGDHAAARGDPILDDDVDDK